MLFAAMLLVAGARMVGDRSLPLSAVDRGRIPICMSASGTRSLVSIIPFQEGTVGSRVVTDIVGK